MCFMIDREKSPPDQNIPHSTSNANNFEHVYRVRLLIAVKQLEYIFFCADDEFFLKAMYAPCKLMKDNEKVASSDLSTLPGPF